MSRRSIVGFSVASLAGLVLVLGGCQSTPEPAPAPDTGSEWQESETVVEEVTEVVVVDVELGTVYFDFDRYDIRQDARPVLRANADALGDVPGVVTVEGHTDERGSAEYNLALGDRRARAVKQYLVDLGVPSSKVRTVSFGEDRPAVQGHDESAWRYNRRGEFAIGR